MSANPPPVPVNCPGCGNQIGEEVDIHVRGIVLFHAGGGLWRDLRGHCAQCGLTFYWSASDKLLQQLTMVTDPPDDTGGE